VSKPFRGVINVDIRDSEPDWRPFEPPRAPDSAPSVLYIVLDDVGFSALGCYGGPVDTPNIDQVARQGVRYTQWHTTALCSPTQCKGQRRLACSARSDVTAKRSRALTRVVPGTMTLQHVPTGGLAGPGTTCRCRAGWSALT
jgi:hypothetical protein